MRRRNNSHTYIFAFAGYSSVSRRKCLIYKIWSHYVCIWFLYENKMYCCSYHPTSDHYIKTQLSLLFIQNFFSCLLLQCNIAQYLWAFLFVYLISYTHCTLCFIKNIVSKYCSLFCTSNSSVVLLIESSLHFR